MWAHYIYLMNKETKEHYKFRIEPSKIKACSKFVELNDKQFESVSHLIRKFISDGMKKLNIH